MKVIELFSGIGASIMALNQLGIENEVIGISEIDKLAVKCYSMLHGDVENFGDIKSIKELPPCDFIHCSSPCQSWSRKGKQNGREGVSGLIFEFFRLLENYKERNILPKYISFENIPELKRVFTEDYDILIQTLQNCGYNVYEKILKAHYFDNPTIRERLYVIGIRKDIDTGRFKMPDEEEKTELKIQDFLLSEVDPYYYWKHKVIFHPETNRENDIVVTRKLGWLETKCGHQTESNQVWSTKGYCPCITCTAKFWIRIDNDTYRKLTPEELWRIQGFSQEDFEKIRGQFSRSAVIRFVGNSIALGPLKAIYKNLFESQEEE